MLNVAQIGNPVSLTCWRRSATDEVDILDNIAQPVFTFDQQGRLQGLLAESWEMRAPNNWILHLREDAPFHDPSYGVMEACGRPSLARTSRTWSSASRCAAG